MTLTWIPTWSLDVGLVGKAMKVRYWYSQLRRVLQVEECWGINKQVNHKSSRLHINFWTRNCCSCPPEYLYVLLILCVVREEMWSDVSVARCWLRVGGWDGRAAEWGQSFHLYFCSRLLYFLVCSWCAAVYFPHYLSKYFVDYTKAGSLTCLFTHSFIQSSVYHSI